MLNRTKTLTRREMATAVSRESHLTRAEAGRLINAIVEEIAATLVRGEAVRITGFGNFVVRSKAARVGRNFKTGVVAPVSARRVVLFRPSMILKRRVSPPA